MRCLYPVLLKRPENGSFKYWYNLNGLSYVEVPCGRCHACRKERSKAWALRLMLESLYYRDSIFLTLTYDDLHIPLVHNGDKCPYSLKKDDLQRFWKRLRKDLDYQGRKIKYYAVGEYGDETFRPHYHAIVFGLSKYDEELIKDNWSNGLVDVGNVDMASCNYVAGYIQKKLYGDVSQEVYGNRLPPFSCMSKGLGKRYVLENHEEMLKFGFVRYHGSKLTIPRYFWEQMIKEGILSEKELCDIKHEQAEVMKKKELIELERRGISTNVQRFYYEESKIDARRRVLDKIAEIQKRRKI